MKNLTIIILVSFLVFINVPKLSASYEETIPPEILNKFEKSILSGDRPVFGKITQAMIFSLRDQPDQGGEIYKLDLDPKKLSSVQLEILKNWIKAGHNILFWGKSEASKCAVLFSEAIQFSQLVWEEKPTLNKHPVNTDIKDVRFYTEENNGMRSLNLLNKYPSDTEVIVSIEIGVIAGRAPYGKGNIYFALFDNTWMSGVDKDRWTLNFNQWMLGLKVPEAANVNLKTKIKDAF